MRIRLPVLSEHRQMLPLASLMMLAILGMAALAIDGSNLYSQHRRWQADLDVGVGVAASGLNSSTSYTTTLQQAMSSLTQTLARDGYPVSGAPTCEAVPSMAPTPCNTGTFLNGMCLTTSGVTLCNPPQTTPFKGLSHYAQGTISYDVPGFFGRVIGLGKMHINVQAVAKHIGSYPLNPYAIIGLDPSPSNGCSIDAQGSTGGSFYVDGSIRSDDVGCAAVNANMTVTGSSDMTGIPASIGKFPITGTLGTNIGLGPIVDPYPQIPLPPLVTAPISTYNTIPDSCKPEVTQYFAQAGATPPSSTSDYYVFGGAPGTAVQFNWVASGGGRTPPGNYYFLPGCDGDPAGTGTVPGVFYFTGQIDNSGSGSTLINVQTFSSTVILPDVLSSDSFNYKTSGTGSSAGTFFGLDAPGPGYDPYSGIALTQLRTYANGQLDCGTGSLPSLDLAGNTSLGIPIIGIIDSPCTDVTVLGSSSGGSPSMLGVLVANTVKFGGSGSFTLQYDPQYHGLMTGGSTLVY